MQTFQRSRSPVGVSESQMKHDIVMVIIKCFRPCHLNLVDFVIKVTSQVCYECFVKGSAVDQCKEKHLHSPDRLQVLLHLDTEWHT